MKELFVTRTKNSGTKIALFADIAAEKWLLQNNTLDSLTHTVRAVILLAIFFTNEGQDAETKGTLTWKCI